MSILPPSHQLFDAAAHQCTMEIMVARLLVVFASLVAVDAFHISGSDPSLWNHSRFSYFQTRRLLASADKQTAAAEVPNIDTADDDNAINNKKNEKNQVYIQGLLDNLLQQCDRWIVTGSDTCVERANNILYQIQQKSLNPNRDVTRAREMMQHAGMSVTNELTASNNKSTDANERRRLAEERTKWEQDWEQQVDQGRSALSRRAAKNSKPDMLLGTIGSNLETFANEKKQLQTTMDGKSNDTPSDDDNDGISKDSLQDAATKSAELVALAGKGGNFEGESMGIGGLDAVLGEIKRRIWVPLAAPPTLLGELGISPVRGLLLYGKPGCGKSLLARTIGQVLSPSRPITVVSGPELMDKYVGSSEKNLREVFDNPPDIYEKNNPALAAAALHVIIMDEFDAMARSRGGKGGGGDQSDAGVARDSVVNQLLAKMDGVDALVVPTLVIGLTNKRSLIDAALLRPGRFEVQVEVPPPKTAAQRISILKVHTKQMMDAGRLLVSDAPADTAAARYSEVRLFNWNCVSFVVVFVPCRRHIHFTFDNRIRMWIIS